MSELAKVNVSELIGAALDWAVAVSQGLEPDTSQDGLLSKCVMDVSVYVVAGPDRYCDPAQRYAPSTDWAICGPLIELYQINLLSRPSPEDWCGAFIWKGVDRILQDGESLLIAACRAIVAATLGETVKVPKALVA